MPNAVVSALSRALFSLLHWRMLVLMVWPVLVSILIWAVMAALFWSSAAAWVDRHFQASDVVQWMMQYAILAFVAANLSHVLLLLAFVPLVLVTAVLIIGIFAMPAMVRHVESRYPGLERRSGGTFAGSIGNSAVALVVFLVLAGVTLPLWLLPFLWPVLPVLLLAYLNQRVFRYDALAEHADAGEMRVLLRRYRAEWFLLGLVVSLVGHVPILGLFAPVYGGLVFIHYGLERLRRLRGDAGGAAARYLG